MDHHCPYTDNCVGAHNVKAFILFCFYGGVFALQFLVLSVLFYFQVKAGNAKELGETGVLVWMFLAFISFFLTLSMNGLAISNIMMIGKNVTQLDMLKGIFMFSDKHGLHPNPFDLGYLSNWNSVFVGDYWTFWYPSEIINDNDST